ncbi:MAG: LCP family protein [Treponema sp.]|nr:LCP family protein [Treponema sp.]
MAVSKEKLSALFLVAILAVMIGAVVVMASTLTSDPLEETLAKNEVVKTLLVINDGEGNALVTDIFAFYPPYNKGALFDIPGNIGDIFDKSLGRTDRIDAIYREKGMKTYVAEIERLTDTVIPFTIDINLDNLSLLTDLLGGLNVLVYSPVDTVTEEGERWLLPSGQITLDGDKVRTYVTYRLPGESDSDVDDRRQNVLVALLSAITENKKNVLRKKDFSVYASKFDASVEGDLFYKLLSLICSVNTDSLSPLFPQGMLRTTSTGQQLWFLQDGGQLIKDVIKTTLATLVSEEERGGSRVYVVEIQNATSVTGSARNAAFLLQGMGYEVLKYGNADNEMEHTLIVSHVGDSESLRVLSDFIKCKYIEYEEVKPLSYGNESSDVDFTVYLGKDWDGRYVRGGYTGKEEED